MRKTMKKYPPFLRVFAVTHDVEVIRGNVAGRRNLDM